MVLEAVITIVLLSIAVLGGYTLGYIAGRTDKDYEEWTEKN